jgi:hypothetical protein
MLRPVAQCVGMVNVAQAAAATCCVPSVASAVQTCSQSLNAIAGSWRAGSTVLQGTTARL